MNPLSARSDEAVLEIGRRAYEPIAGAVNGSEADLAIILSAILFLRLAGARKSLQLEQLMKVRLTSRRSTFSKVRHP